MTPGTTGRRAERIAERIKVALMELLLRGVVRDPGAKDVYITAVQVSDDLSHARVYIRLLRDSVSPADQRAAVDALGRASGFLRRELASRLEVKHQPEIRFFWDEGMESASRIEELLAEISREGGSRS